MHLRYSYVNNSTWHILYSRCNCQCKPTYLFSHGIVILNHALARFWSIAAGLSCCGMRPCLAPTPKHALKLMCALSKECDITFLLNKSNDSNSMSNLLSE